MSTRYASIGTGIRRSPKTSVIRPWFAMPRNEIITANTAFPVYGTTAHTKGAWSQLTASLTDNCSMIFLAPQLAASGVDTATLLDIGVGAAGSETVVVPNIAIGGSNAIFFAVPVAIPSGSRVAVRIQGSRTSPTNMVNGMAWQLHKTESYAQTPASVDIIGIDTATSYGTTLSGSSGSWTQITSSTSKDYQALIMIPSLASSDIPVTNNAGEWSLGVGAAGSETVLAVQNVRTATVEQASNNWVMPIAGGVPAGSRLAVRHRFTQNPERYAACVIGVPYV